MKSHPAHEEVDAETITVKVTREEYPQLFEHLLAVTKGKRRATRFRALAVKGLQSELAGYQQPVPTSNTTAGGNDPAPVRHDHAAAAAAQMFSNDWDAS